VIKMEVKSCKECKELKILSEFAKDSRMKEGYSNQCKVCRNNYQRKYRTENPDLVAKYSEKEKISKKKYYEKNKESHLFRNKKYYAENREKILKQQKAYAEKNKEKISTRYKEWQEKNKDELKAYQEKWRKDNKHIKQLLDKKYKEENREKCLARYKEYREKNSEKVKAAKQRWYKTPQGKESLYNARLKRRSYKHDVKFTAHQRKYLLDRDNWTCQNCGIKVHDRSTGNWNTPDKAHIDHIIALSQGGTSEPHNLQVLCRTCNLSKQNKKNYQMSLFG
jgi:hypothetical protein